MAVGLTYDVGLTITDVDYNSSSTYRRSRISSSSWIAVSGTYAQDGESHEVTNSHWFASADLDEGQVVNVQIGPIWWNQMFASPRGIIMTAVTGLFPLLVCYLLVRFTFFPKRKVRLVTPAPHTNVVSNRHAESQAKIVAGKNSRSWPANEYSWVTVRGSCRCPLRSHRQPERTLG